MAEPDRRLKGQYRDWNENQKIFFNDITQTALTPFLLLSPRTFTLSRIPQVGLWAGGVVALAAGGPLAPVGLALFGANFIMNRFISGKQTRKYKEAQFLKQEEKIIRESNEDELTSKRFQKVREHLNTAHMELGQLNHNILQLKNTEYPGFGNAKQSSGNVGPNRAGLSGIATAQSGPFGRSGNDQDGVTADDLRKMIDTEGREQLLERIEAVEQSLKIIRKNTLKLNIDGHGFKDQQVLKKMHDNVSDLKKALKAGDDGDLVKLQQAFRDVNKSFNGVNKSVESSRKGYEKYLKGRGVTAERRLKEMDKLEEHLQVSPGSAFSQLRDREIRLMAEADFKKAALHTPQILDSIDKNTGKSNLTEEQLGMDDPYKAQKKTSEKTEANTSPAAGG